MAHKTALELRPGDDRVRTENGVYDVGRDYRWGLPI
jgi:hypothetical protein